MFNMLTILKLILPVVIPSWKFFDVIVASPRIFFTLLDNKDAVDHDWVEFRSRSNKINFTTMLGRLLFNAQWNENLFLISCAERVVEYPTPQCEHEILKRIIDDITDFDNMSNSMFVKFRLVFIRRDGDKLVEEIKYESQVTSIKHSNSL